MENFANFIFLSNQETGRLIGNIKNKLIICQLAVVLKKHIYIYVYILHTLYIYILIHKVYIYTLYIYLYMQKVQSCFATAG